MQCRNSFFDYLLVFGEPKIVIGAKVNDVFAVDFGRGTPSNHRFKTTIQAALFKKIKLIIDEGGLMV